MAAPLPRHIMLVDLSQYLADTHGMNPLAAYAYNNLLIYHWLRGHLPVQNEALAFVAQIPMDAWSMLGASIMHAFQMGSDGHFHHTPSQKMRDEEQAKSLKRSEHARRAAMVRWHRAEMEQEGEIPAKIEHGRASIEHETKCNNSLEGSPSRALPFLKPLIKSTTMRAREADGQDVLFQTEDGKVQEAQCKGHRSVTKAKPRKSDRRAIVEYEDDVVAFLTNANVKLGHRNRGKQVFKSRSDGKNEPAAKDARFEGCRREIFAMWARVNLKGPSCTWQTLDIEALNTMLREHADLTEAQFKTCVEHVEASIRAGELSATKPARSWLPRAVEFLSGPLDRYRNPLREPGEPPKKPPRQY